MKGKKDMAKDNNLTSKIRIIMEQIKNQALLEEKKRKKNRSYTIHPDQKKNKKDKK